MRLTIFSFIISVLGFAAIATGCNTDSGTSGVAEGEPTYIKVQFSTPRQEESRAGNDQNATDAEQTVNSIDVFIFEESTGLQVTHKRLEASDFTGPVQSGNKDVYTSDLPIATTSGRKKIILAVNLPNSNDGDLGKELVYKPLYDFITAAHDVTTEQFSDAVNGFIMFSTAAISKELVPSETGDDNKITGQVERLVAKLTIQLPDGGPEVAGGSVSDMKFVVNNRNLKGYLVRRMNWVDPNWETYKAGDFTANAPESEYVAVNDHQTTVPNLNVKYMTENTSQNYTKKETTYATVQAKFIPKTIKVFANGSDASGGFVNESDHGIVVPQTFWSVDALGARDYFYDETVADEFAIFKGGSSVAVKTEYTDGKCYYNMWLNPGDNFDVRRNDYYKATIRRILGPGGSDDQIRNPDDPADLPTNILVDIEVLHWNFKEDDYDLVP